MKGGDKVKIEEAFKKDMRKRLKFLILGEGIIVLALLIAGIGVTIATDSGSSFFAILLFIAMLIVILVIVLAVLMFGKSSTKHFHQCLDTFSASERLEIEHALENAITIGTVTITNLIVIYQAGIFLHALPTRDIIWIYPNDQYVYGVRLQNFTIVTRNKKTRSIAVGKISAVEMDLLLKAVQKVRPHVIIGYDDEKMKLFKKDFDEMVHMADRW